MTLENFLEHAGVKGMKWGVRKDRKTTPSTSTIAKGLSDSDLRAKVKRLNMEKQYVDLTRQAAERETTAMQKGLEIASGILLNSGKQVLGVIVTKSLMSLIPDTD